SGLALWQRQPFAAGALRSLADSGRIDQPVLDDYALWRDPSGSPRDRYFALRRALASAMRHAADSPTDARLAIVGRFAHEAGARHIASQTGLQLFGVASRNTVSLDEPFWPPSPRYDEIDCGDNPHAWLVAATIEALVHVSAFSGFYVGTGWLSPLDWLG